jgi:hypothetical protein
MTDPMIITSFVVIALSCAIAAVALCFVSQALWRLVEVGEIMCEPPAVEIREVEREQFPLQQLERAMAYEATEAALRPFGAPRER